MEPVDLERLRQQGKTIIYDAHGNAVAIQDRITRERINIAPAKVAKGTTSQRIEPDAQQPVSEAGPGEGVDSPSAQIQGHGDGGEVGVPLGTTQPTTQQGDAALPVVSDTMGNEGLTRAPQTYQEALPPLQEILDLLARSDPNCPPESDVFKSAVLLIASLIVGYNAERLVQYTHLPLAFIAARVTRLVENGIWREGKPPYQVWFKDPKVLDTLSIWCDAAVADGRFYRVGPGIQYDVKPPRRRKKRVFPSENAQDKRSSDGQAESGNSRGASRCAACSSTHGDDWLLCTAPAFDVERQDGLAENDPQGEAL